MKKDTIKTIVIIVLIVLILGVFFIPKYNQAVYERGFIAGQVNVIQTQMQTGNIFIVNDGTIEGYPICSFCESNSMEELN